jgi:hypothetical protein
MSTENLTTDSGAPSAPPPSVMDEDSYAALSPEDRRKELYGDAEPKVDTPKPKTNGHDTGSDALKADDDAEPGEIRIEADGQVRDKKSGRFVPYELYAKTREKVKSRDGELTKLRTESATAEGRYKELSAIVGLLTPEQKAEAKPEPRKAVDPDEDVIGAMKFALAELEELKKTAQESHQTITAQTENTKVLAAYEKDIGATIKEKADFPDAYAHLRQIKDRELEVRGIKDPARREAMLRKAESDLVHTALKEGRSAAQELYALAEVYGYAKKAAPAANGKSEAEAKIEAIKSGMQAGASLAGAGGVSAEGISEGSISKMNEDEYGKLKAQLSKAEWRKLMGG